MDAERARAFMLSLPHAVETMQWGSNLVFWAGDKAVGGKMFALVNLELGEHGVISYAAGDRFYELIEHEGIKPAPYMARIFWVAADGWSVWRNSEWEDELRTAYERTFAKLPPRTRTVLALPERERNKIIAARRKELAAQAEPLRPRRRRQPKPYHLRRRRRLPRRRPECAINA
jgi:predicted DNA-binding protein (MmcQ/YjbR family)